jgi:hypothetical protein
MGPPDGDPAEPAYDMFDSLKQARSKAKQSRPKRQLPGQNELQGDAQPDEE